MNEFIQKLRSLRNEADNQRGRHLNRDSFSRWVRIASEPATYILHEIGVKAPQVLFAHFAADLAGLYHFASGNYLSALAFFAFAHYLDNIDGDLARARNEQHEKWHQVDVDLHAVAIAIFWAINYLAVGTHAIIALMGIYVLSVQRGQLDESSRYGEQSKAYRLLALPLNVNYMLSGGVIAAYAGVLMWYAALYAVYVWVAVIGQVYRKANG